ncbi:ORF6N domain-containing protein [Flavobacterium sp.]|uniref:ORF6N domain-containing protein n=1 Tax=Flavobacterium sp. TaxID=239 RepID=UPI002619ED47|nr:ORF6N domain-containing protein [Flavobacterium sp.]MDD3004266.1 ORF6N domain-containing protein [Flavobacterium sp.]
MENELLKIENHIFTFRGLQVMLDRDLATMYHVETKVLNQAVKRNSDRFPDAFRFQLSDEEKTELVTNCDRLANLKHASTNPYVFTEQGVAMLSAVLRSETAIKVSIQIMQAFVEMRKNIHNNLSLLQLSTDFEQFKLNTTQQFDKIFNVLENNKELPKQGVFFNGQTYDAYVFVNQIIKTAEKSITLIDNYMDDTVITLLTAKKQNVQVHLLMQQPNKKLELDVQKVNTQYPTFQIKKFSLSHDRFLIIDNQTVYHIGASLKDLGKKWFAFTKLEQDTVKLLGTLNELV